jgi:HD-GYP domain-containing protein (c-di-GMP phosphodiesterase class II)
MSVADMHDALVSERVYKKEWAHEEAAQEIIHNKGVRFDPLVANAFIAEQESFQAIGNQNRNP